MNTKRSGVLASLEHLFDIVITNEDNMWPISVPSKEEIDSLCKTLFYQIDTSNCFPTQKGIC